MNRHRIKYLSILLIFAISMPNALGAPKTITTKTQIQNGIKNMQLMVDSISQKIDALDLAYDACLEKYDQDHPDNRQIKNRFDFCDSDPSFANRETLESECLDICFLLDDASLAARRSLKSKTDFESAFILALNFEWAWKSFYVMAKKQTWEIQASQVAEVAKAQNLYYEGSRIADNYNQANAKKYLQKIKVKIDSKAAMPFLSFLRKAAFSK